MDIHGYVAGQTHLEGYGDLSTIQAYYDQLENQIKQDNLENISSIYLSNGGDTCEGTGLSDLTPIRCSVIYDSTSYLKWNSYTIGNHDLGLGNESMEYLLELFESNQIPNVISTNVLFQNNSYFALPYKYEELSNGARILSLGAMYGSGNYDNLQVSNIVEQMNQTYMQEIFNQYQDKIDAVVINCHIGHEDEQLPQIHSFLRNQFRQQNENLPIIILSAHTHTVQYNNTYACENDPNCYSFEAGCYMKDMQHINISIGFDENNKSYINNVEYYTPATNIISTYAERFNLTVDEFPTEQSQLIQDYVNQQSIIYGVSDIQGYSKYYYEQAISDIRLPNCLAKLYFGTAFDAYVKDPSAENQITLCAYGSIRSPMYQGNITKDDIYKVMPFPNGYIIVKNLTCQTIHDFMTLGNEEYKRYDLIKECEYGDKRYDILTDTYNGPYLYDYGSSVDPGVTILEYEPRDSRLTSTSQLLTLFVQEQMQLLTYTLDDIEVIDQTILMAVCTTYSIILYLILFILSINKQILSQNKDKESYDVLLA